MDAMSAIPSQGEESKDGNNVSLLELSELTGFPESFIKKELVLGEDESIDMDKLRKLMLGYLDQTFAND